MRFTLYLSIHKINFSAIDIECEFTKSERENGCNEKKDLTSDA